MASIGRACRRVPLPLGWMIQRHFYGGECVMSRKNPLNLLKLQAFLYDHGVPSDPNMSRIGVL